jgi:hypothetical protein
MIISHSIHPRMLCGTLATIALAVTLTACGSGASAGNGTNTLAVPPTKNVAATTSAAPNAPAAVALASAAPSAQAVASIPAAAAASTYSGSRWHGLPTPGTIKLHQEETNRYSIFVAGTQQAVVKLYDDAYLADGWVQATQSTASGSRFFTYSKAGRRVIVAVGPDLGTDSVIVVIDDTL